MTSMTGYAYCEDYSDDIEISVEIKSVNSRFLDLFINLPPYLNKLEQELRYSAMQKILRGKVDINIRVKETQFNGIISADTEAAKKYVHEIGKIAGALDRSIKDIPLKLIINQPGVLNFDKKYDIEKYKKAVFKIFNRALDDFMIDRMREGKNLKKDISLKLNKLYECKEIFKKLQLEMECRFKEQIISKFKELLGEHCDMQRIMAETAVMLVKYTINEEIVRFESHLEALQSELENTHAPGRKIDFICQEINREINTIGSKSQFKEIGEAVVEAKEALENIREQARNIE